MSGDLLEIRGLSVSHAGAFALRAVDLDIHAGAKLAVIGESGSGKTTLALALAGLLPPEVLVEGRVEWPGLDRAPLTGRDTGLVFQDPAASLNPVIPVGEQVVEGARRYLGLGRKAAHELARNLLERVRIPEPEAALAAYAHQFSGGQLQRIAIAAAIAARPRLLIADEATSALDTVVQASIVALLEELVREEGMTLVFITHDLALASNLADTIAVLKDGILVETGPTDQVLVSPAHPYTRRLLDAQIDLSAPRLVGEAC